MLEDDVKTSKASCNNSHSKESMGQDLTENDIGNLRMCSNHQSEAAETISKLKVFMRDHFLFQGPLYLSFRFCDLVQAPGY